MFSQSTVMMSSGGRAMLAPLPSGRTDENLLLPAPLLIYQPGIKSSSATIVVF